MREVEFGSLLAEPLRNGVSYPSRKRGSGVRMINMREIFAHDRITSDIECELAPLTDREIETSTLEFGDLLFARQSLTYEGAGKVAIVMDESSPTWESHLIRARFDPSRAVPEYFYYFFQSFEGRRRMGTIVQQVAAAGIRGSELARLRVPAPELSAQRAIAAVLSALDDKIAANTALVATADELVRSEYLALDPQVRVRIGNVATSPRKGIAPTSVDPVTPYLGLEHIPRRLMWAANAGVAADVSSVKSAFVEGDVLFGKLRPYFHKVVSASYPGICSTDVIVVRAKEARLSSVLLAALASDDVIQSVVAASEGTRMPRTSWKDLAAVEIRWPTAESAPALVDRLDAIRAVALAALAENRYLAETRDALVPSLMSGKVHVRDTPKEAGHDHQQRTGRRLPDDRGH